MHIRKTTINDLPTVMAIYTEARTFMKTNGNPNQWGDTHPLHTQIENDIKKGASYVCVDNNEIVAVFYFAVEKDPAYAKIEGKWLNNEPYGVIHRIARSKNGTGSGEFCLKWCLAQHPNIRIDTHIDNQPMKKLLAKLGFVFCGIIWVRVNEERLAFAHAYQKQ